MANPIPVTAAQPKASPVLKYKNIRGRKIFKADGNPMKQVDGYFQPSTEEEKELCKYFASIGHLELIEQK